MPALHASVHKHLLMHRQIKTLLPFPIRRRCIGSAGFADAANTVVKVAGTYHAARQPAEEGHRLRQDSFFNGPRRAVQGHLGNRCSLHGTLSFPTQLTVVSEISALTPSHFRLAIEL